MSVRERKTEGAVIPALPAYAEFPDWVLFPWLQEEVGVGFKPVAVSKKGS